MDPGYGQFCTVARGAEALCERWTPLVVRELLMGSHRFNDLHRGVPRMSTSLLTQRLRHLEEIGVVRRRVVGKVREYHLTEAGEALRPIVLALGHWVPDARSGERAWWLVVEDGTADLCRDDPGREPTLVVHTGVRTLTDLWSGERTPQQALAARRVRVQGAPRHSQRLWDWLGTSPFAPTRAAARQAAAARG